MAKEYKEKFIEEKPFEPTVVPGVNAPKLDEDISVNSSSGSNSGGTLDYFIGTISYSAGSSSLTVSTIASTTKVSNAAMVAGNTIVIQKEGVYQINVTNSRTANTSGIRKVFIYINNIRYTLDDNFPNQSGPSFNSLSAASYLYVGDVVDTRVFQNSGSLLSTVIDGNKFQVVQVS